MIRFIVCDDNTEIVEKARMVVNKVMMPYDYDYTVDRFFCYDEKFKKIIEDSDEEKIYILDIELPKVTGLDIADKIREKDWKSIIIFLTSHYECKDCVFDSRLMVLDYISKFTKYEKTLEKTLKTALSILSKKEVLKFNYNHSAYRIPYDEILYIKASPDKRNVVYTSDGNEYIILEKLKNLEEILAPNFHRCHKNCIANVAKVRTVNLKDETITFDNGTKEKLMSYRLKKDFIRYVKDFK